MSRKPTQPLRCPFCGRGGVEVEIRMVEYEGGPLWDGSLSCGGCGANRYRLDISHHVRFATPEGMIHYLIREWNDRKKR